jgi:hypothetical protein
MDEGSTGEPPAGLGSGQGDPTDPGSSAATEATPPSPPFTRRALSTARQVRSRARDVRIGLEGRGRRMVAPLSARAEHEVERIRQRFHSPLHSEWLAAVMGIALGVSFTVCFLTGLVDYLAQNPPTSWFHLPVHPINLYRVTEGIHVLTGIIVHPACCWPSCGSSIPNLFSYPPVHGTSPMRFRASEPDATGRRSTLRAGDRSCQHHLLVQSDALRLHHGPLLCGLDRHRRSDRPHWCEVDTHSCQSCPAGTPVRRCRRWEPQSPRWSTLRPRSSSARGLSRRGLLATVGAAAGVLFVTVAGETVAPLRKLALWHLATR